MSKKLLSLATLVIVAGLASQPVYATQPEIDESHKVTICHRTNSVKNPYVQISVDNDAADGNTGNDNGKKDHSLHTGPVATSETAAQTLKDAKTKWGDIIPPHDNFVGLNWTSEGQAVYNNGCKYVTGGSGGETPVTPSTPATTTPVAQVTATPVKGVNAGGGGGAASAAASLVALGGSIATLGYGVLRFRKFNA